MSSFVSTILLSVSFCHLFHCLCHFVSTVLLSVSIICVICFIVCHRLYQYMFHYLCHQFFHPLCHHLCHTLYIYLQIIGQISIKLADSFTGHKAMHLLYTSNFVFCLFFEAFLGFSIEYIIWHVILKLSVQALTFVSFIFCFI